MWLCLKVFSTLATHDRVAYIICIDWGGKNIAIYCTYNYWIRYDYWSFLCWVLEMPIITLLGALELNDMICKPGRRGGG